MFRSVSLLVVSAVTVEALATVSVACETQLMMVFLVASRRLSGRLHSGSSWNLSRAATGACDRCALLYHRRHVSSAVGPGVGLMALPPSETAQARCSALASQVALPSLLSSLTAADEADLCHDVAQRLQRLRLIHKRILSQPATEPSSSGLPFTTRQMATLRCCMEAWAELQRVSDEVVERSADPHAVALMIAGYVHFVPHWGRGELGPDDAERSNYDLFNNQVGLGGSVIDDPQFAQGDATRSGHRHPGRRVASSHERRSHGQSQEATVPLAASPAVGAEWSMATLE